MAHGLEVWFAKFNISTRISLFFKDLGSWFHSQGISSIYTDTDIHTDKQSYTKPNTSTQGHTQAGTHTPTRINPTLTLHWLKYNWIFLQAVFIHTSSISLSLTRREASHSCMRASGPWGSDSLRFGNAMKKNNNWPWRKEQITTDELSTRDEVSPWV